MLITYITNGLPKEKAGINQEIRHYITQNQTSGEIINHFKNWFAVHGISDTLPTDNGK